MIRNAKNRARRRGVLTLILILAGCSTAHSANPQRVVAVGDSITYFSTDAIHARLPNAVVDSVYGYTATQIAGLARKADRPDVLIVNAGTGDALLKTRWQHGFLQLITISHRSPCAWFVTLNEARLGKMAVEWDARLRARHVRIIDWNAAVAHNPGLVDRTGYHPSNMGKRWIATAYKRAVDAC